MIGRSQGGSPESRAVDVEPTHRVNHGCSVCRLALLTGQSGIQVLCYTMPELSVSLYPLLCSVTEGPAVASGHLCSTPRLQGFSQL